MAYSKENTRIENYYRVNKGLHYSSKCTICNDDFKSASIKTIYCSQRCKNDAYIERRKKRKQNELNKKCIICNNDFKAIRKDTKFCSNKCRQKKYRYISKFI